MPVSSKLAGTLTHKPEITVEGTKENLGKNTGKNGEGSELGKVSEIKARLKQPRRLSIIEVSGGQRGNRVSRERHNNSGGLSVGTKSVQSGRSDGNQGWGTMPPLKKSSRKWGGLKRRTSFQRKDDLCGGGRVRKVPTRAWKGGMARRAV